jgi:hypothetical protein
MKPKLPPGKRRVNFILHVYGTTDRQPYDWADGVARSLQATLNEASAEAEFPEDITVEVDDFGEGG